MKLDITFEESNQRIDVQFAEAQIASDGGFERGYEQGYTEGNENGYKNGYFEGQEQSASLFGIPNEVKGTNIVTCDYVNENEHDVEVKLSSDNITDFSDKQVKVIGKNWWCLNNHYEGANFLVPITPFKFPKGKVGFSFNSDTENASYELTIYDENKTVIKAQSTDIVLGKNEAVFELTKECAFVRLYVSSKVAISDIQIELNTVTDYEPYTEKTYTANADGTVDGVTSISPVMNLICDTEGVDISAKYYCAQDVEWHRFWDDYQKQGTLENYSNLFAGAGWTVKTFKPKYDINPKASGSTNIFTGNLIKIDLAEHLDSLNIKLDLSQAINSYSTFNSAYFTRLPLLDMSSCTAMNTTFGYMNYLEIIDELIVNENCIFTNTFMQCTALRFIKMSGKIGKSINFQWSGLLSVESAKNIIQCLANLVDKNPFTQTITFHDDVWSKLAEEGNTSPNGNTWEDYLFNIGWNKG